MTTETVPELPRGKMRELDSISEDLSDDAILVRAAIVNISAKFAYGDAEADKERSKLEKILRLIIQQHLKSLSQCTKLLVMGIVKREHARAMDGIKGHLGTLLAGQIALAEQRGRIFRGEQDPMLVEVTPTLVGADGQPVQSAPPAEASHTEAPKADIQS